MLTFGKKTWMVINQLSTIVLGKAARLRKMWKRTCHVKKSKKSQGKRKASFASKSTTKKPKKWSWTLEAVEILLKYIKEFKTKCDFNRVDFAANLSTIYAEMRRCMAVDFPEDFGPAVVQEQGKELKDMNSNEHEFYRKELEVQKRHIRNGYQRIKEKVKSVLTMGKVQ